MRSKNTAHEVFVKILGLPDCVISVPVSELGALGGNRKGVDYAYLSESFGMEWNGMEWK